MQWLIDIIYDKMVAAGFATQAWVIGKQYATVIWVGEQITNLQNWVIAQGYISQSFFDRGDPAAPDFAVGDLTTDGNWHRLDLSLIVPPSAKGVCLNVAILTPTVAAVVRVRQLGNVNTANWSSLRCQVAVVGNEADLTCSLDSLRRLEYWITNTVWFGLNITVKNWWF